MLAMPVLYLLRLYYAYLLPPIYMQGVQKSRAHFDIEYLKNYWRYYEYNVFWKLLF